MRKCSICGKTISDFVTSCPYCGSNLNSVNEIENNKKKEYYSTLNARKSVLISFILSLVVMIFFRFVFGLPTFTIITLIELLLEIACIIFAIFLIVRYKIITISKNKGFLIAAIVIGILFSLLQFFITTRLYEMGRFILVGIPIIYKAAGILTYVIAGVMMSTLIIEARFLLFQKRK